MLLSLTISKITGNARRGSPNLKSDALNRAVLNFYATNAVESLHRALRKVIKTRGSFPTEEAALKLLFLAIRHSGVRWKRAIAWTEAFAQFTIMFGERLSGSSR